MIDFLVSYWPVWFLLLAFGLGALVVHWDRRVERARRSLAEQRTPAAGSAWAWWSGAGTNGSFEIQGGGGFRRVESRPDPRARLAESTARMNARPLGGCDSVVPAGNVVPFPRGGRKGVRRVDDAS